MSAMGGKLTLQVMIRFGAEDRVPSRVEVSFTLAGNGQDEHNTPKDMTDFFLQPRDIPAFDRDVKQVSAYFAK